MSALAWVAATPWQQLGAVVLLAVATLWMADELGGSEGSEDDD